MSSYEPKDFRIGEPLESSVANHIQSLQNVFGAHEGDLRTSYIELQGSTPWIKMQSGAELSGSAASDYGAFGNRLAKDNILFALSSREVNASGSVYYDLDAGPLPGYENSDQFGLRPRPGITGMNIVSHNRFGSLRTATVSFQCWTKEQMDVMEVLYMRPGMTVLLEWGHSKVLKSTTQVEPSDFGIDYFTASRSVPELISRIHRKRETERYSYDAIIGIVKNFSWSFRADGGYDCQVSLVTSGDLIESYKANFYLKQSDVNKSLLAELQEYKEENNAPSGSVVTFKFPSVHEDSRAVDYSTAIPINELDSTYQQFCAAANKALAESATYFQSYLDTLADDDARLKVLTDLGFDGTKKLDGLLPEIKKLMGSLRVVQGGMKVGQVERRAVGTNDQDAVVYGDIQIQSSWVHGIADLNTSENNLDQGIIKTGIVAVLPLAGDYPNPLVFTKAVNDLIAVQDLTDLRTPVYAVSMIFDLIKLGTFTVGSNTVKMFSFDGNGDYFKNTGKYTNKQEYGDYMEPAWVPHMKYEAYANYRGTDLGNFYDLPLKYTEAELSAFPIDYAGINLRAIARQSTLYYRPKWSAELTAISNVLSTRQLHHDFVDPKYLGPVHFFPIKFNGFEIIQGLRTTNETVVQTTDPETGKPVGEGFIDPNDDNLSKLHFILRTKLENPYTAQYLKYTFEGANFPGIFGYRNVYSSFDDISEVFNEKIGGGSLRTANLKKYDNGTDNTYTKQLNAWNLLLGGRFAARDLTPTYNTVYIKLGALLELINKHVLKSDDNYFFLFKSMYKNSKSTPLYNTIDDHISVDPEICILPTTIQELNISGQEDHMADLVEPYAPIILNIELGINFVLNTLNKYINDRGQVSVLSFIQEILDEVSRVCGGVNDLQIQYVENSALFHIVDRNAIAPYGKGKYPVVNVFGLNSIVRNVNMVSKITPKLSSMIAISAQDSSFTSTQDASGFGAIMRGITDRVYGDRYDEDRQEVLDNAASETYDAIRERLLEDITDLKVHISLYYQQRTVPPIGKDTQPGVYQNYCNFLTGAESTYRHEGRPTYNFIIPFELQLELYGLSGIQVMDAFVINKDILPKTYGGRTNSPIAFLVTGVEHSISRGNWITRVKTQIYNIDNEAPSRDYKDITLGIVQGIDPSYGKVGSVFGKTWDKLDQPQKDNVVFLYNLLKNTYGFGEFDARAILGVCAKETGFKPQPETSYRNTPSSRIRQVWSFFKDWTDTQINTLKVDDIKFWDTVYGYLRPGKNGNYGGNNTPGDAIKYRGRGLNQITFKNNYTRYNTVYSQKGSPAGTIDLVNSPDDLNRQNANGIYEVAAHICALYFTDNMRSKTRTGFGMNLTQNAALLDAFSANAGTNYRDGASMDSFASGNFAKAELFIRSLPEVIQ